MEKGLAFDPEGILSTFPAIVNVHAATFTGLFIQQKARPMRPGQNPPFPSLPMLRAVVDGQAVGWDLLFPINRNSGPAPYVLYTWAIDMIFTLFPYLCDRNSDRRPAGTTFFGVFWKKLPCAIYIPLPNCWW